MSAARWFARQFWQCLLTAYIRPKRIDQIALLGLIAWRLGGQFFLLIQLCESFLRCHHEACTIQWFADHDGAVNLSVANGHHHDRYVGLPRQ